MLDSKFAYSYLPNCSTLCNTKQQTNLPISYYKLFLEYLEMHLNDK